MKGGSIGFRLAAWYCAVFALGLAAFGVAAWFAMRASIYHAIDDELRDRIRGVTLFMENQISALSLPEIRDEFREHSVLGPGGDLFQVCDQTGQWLYRSVPLENANVTIALPASLPASRFQDMRIENHRLRFYSQRIAVDGKEYTVQVASLMTEAYEALERFRLILLLAAPVLLLLASAGGYWLSTRALPRWTLFHEWRNESASKAWSSASACRRRETNCSVCPRLSTRCFPGWLSPCGG